MNGGDPQLLPQVSSVCKCPRSHCAAPLHSVNVFVCVCVPGVTQLYCIISVIHLFICHRCYHGYYRLTAVFSLRRTQVRCGRGDKVMSREGWMLVCVNGCEGTSDEFQEEDQTILAS